MKRAWWWGLLLLVTACAAPSVPDVTYFRLPPPTTALPHAERALSTLPIEVGVFRAEGIYAEQAMIYSLTADAGALRTYHYHLWSDPPARGLQARLTQLLRAAGVAPLVTERLPASDPALRVHGRILRYERVPQGGGYRAVVALELRVEQDRGEPLLEQTYAAEAAAADVSLPATVQAFATAVDRAFAAFYADLVALGRDGHAG